MPPKNLIGHKLGSYHIVSEIGRGGMGSVYLAEHSTIQRRVAIKVLHPRFLEDDSITERFINEARATNRVGHSGIVDIHDCDSDPAVGVYLVMEYLAGETLAARLEREQQLPLQTACRFTRLMAATLAAAHDNGIIHRDLKPDNLFVVTDDQTGDERIKIVDFGIAKLFGAAGASVKTRTGEVFGTPQYMSPEQCHGAKAVDHRTDIYSLGIIAFQMVCGRPPFVAAGIGQIFTLQITQPPPAPRSINPALPTELEQLLLRTLEKEPDRRQQSMAQLMEELDVVIAALQQAPSIPPTVMLGQPAAGAAPEVLPTVTPVGQQIPLTSVHPGFQNVAPVAQQPGAQLAPVLDTTLSGAASQVDGAPLDTRSVGAGGGLRLWGLIAGLVVVLAGGITTAVLLSSNNKTDPIAPGAPQKALLASANPGAVDMTASSPAETPTSRGEAGEARPGGSTRNPMRAGRQADAGSSATPPAPPTAPVKPSPADAASPPAPAPKPAPPADAGRAAPPPPGQRPTSGGKLDQYYLGRHSLGVNRVTDDRRIGRVKVTRKNGKLMLSGGVRKGRYWLKISGQVKPVSRRKFHLVGTITGVPDMSWAREPLRQRTTRGRFTFISKFGRGYWRLYFVNGRDCPCDDNCGNDFCYISIGF